MCSSADPTQQALRDSQAAFTNTLQSSFKTAFAANQSILGGLTATLTKAIASPQGYTPAEMAALRTGVTDSVASGTANATRANAAFAATHGGADLGSGVAAQIQGQTQEAGMVANSQGQNQITIGNAERQQENYWKAINGLTNVGAAYNPQSYATAETGSANATSTASQVVDAERQQSWNNAFGVVKGVAGLASAAAGIPSFGGGGGAAPVSGTPSSVDGSGFGGVFGGL